MGFYSIHVKYLGVIPEAYDYPCFILLIRSYYKNSYNLVIIICQILYILD